MRSSRSWSLALALVFAVAGPAAAQVANGGFENGLDHWAVTGVAFATGSGFFPGPVEGDLEAVVEPPFCDPTGTPEVAPEALAALAGAPILGVSTLAQTIDVPAGRVLAGRWNFLGFAFTGGTVLDDFAFVAVDGTPQRLARAADAVRASDGFGTETGFRPFMLRFPAGGTHRLALGVADTGDDAASATLVLDAIAVCPDTDADGDGIIDCVDDCPDVADPAQADADDDGRGDACDTCRGQSGADTDGDGICDDLDNCVDVPNPDQADDDFDGIGNACDFCAGAGASDRDGDGVCDGDDNCPDTPNPDQADADFDGIGDACDPCVGVGTADTDGDGVCEESDNCPGLPNPDQADDDRDGVGNACDRCPGWPGTSNAPDRDGDGLPDDCDACPDDPTDACADAIGCRDAFPFGWIVRLDTTTGRAGGGVPLPPPFGCTHLFAPPQGPAALWTYQGIAVEALFHGGDTQFLFLPMLDGALPFFDHMTLTPQGEFLGFSIFGDLLVSAVDLSATGRLHAEALPFGLDPLPAYVGDTLYGVTPDAIVTLSSATGAILAEVPVDWTGACPTPVIWALGTQVTPAPDGARLLTPVLCDVADTQRVVVAIDPATGATTSLGSVPDTVPAVLARPELGRSRTAADAACARRTTCVDGRSGLRLRGDGTLRWRWRGPRARPAARSASPTLCLDDARGTTALAVGDGLHLTRRRDLLAVDGRAAVARTPAHARLVDASGGCWAADYATAVSHRGGGLTLRSR